MSEGIPFFLKENKDDKVGTCARCGLPVFWNQSAVEFDGKLYHYECDPL